MIHTIYNLYTSHHSCILLHFSSLCEQGESYLGELGSLEERNHGMNNRKNYSKVLLWFYQYRCAIELEYSFRVIILTYELAYNFYVMSLTCKTLCLIIHITCMIRIRAKLRWRFVVPSGLPMSYACRSIESESGGIWIVSLYTGVVTGCMGTFGYDNTPRLRGRR